MRDITDKLINAMSLEERRKILGEVESKNNNIAIWKSIKSRLSDKQVEQIISLKGYSNREFNNTIQNMEQITDKAVKKQLKSVIEKSEWYKVFEEVVDNTMGFQYDNYRWEISLALSNFVVWGIKKIEKNVCELCNIGIDTNVYHDIEKYLYESLFSLSCKTLVYEFNRQKNEKKGYTIKNFVLDNFSTAESVIEFYCRYPVMIRRLSTKVNYLVHSISEILRNIDTEYETIKTFFEFNSNKIISLRCGKGDTHKQGNTVCIIEVGENKVVYKPYRDELGERYNSFLKMYNKYVEDIPMYISKNMYFEKFTLYEYIDNKECQNKYQVSRFYHRTGQLLAILHLMGANDMHCENIIAHGEYPVIVDYETVLGNYSYRRKNGNVFDEFSKIVSSSIINIGFFPILIKGVKIGGFNNQGGTQKIEQNAIVNKDDESIFFRKTEFELSANKNVPIYNKIQQNYMEYKNDIISGFECASQIIKCNKDFCLKSIEIFSNVKARVVLQATQNYADILEFSSHPKYLSDMLDMEKLFENILNPSTDVNEAFLYEIRDFHNCDIPIFYVNSSSTELIASDNSMIPDYFYETIEQEMANKIEHIEEIYEFQKIILYHYLECADVLNKGFWERKLKNKEERSLQEILDFLNEKISSRLIKDQNSNTLTWLDMQDNELTCAFSDYYEGVGGLEYYLLKCKRNNIYFTDIDENVGMIRDMLLSKEIFWENDVVALRNGIVSDLLLLSELYEHERTLEVEEKIEALINYIGEKMNDNIVIETLEIAAVLEVVYKVYDLLDNYEALQIIRKLGKMMMEQLKIYGYTGVLCDGTFDIGNIVNALIIVNDLFEEEEYLKECRNIVEKFLKEGEWKEEKYIIWGRELSIKNGELLRIGEKLFRIYSQISKEEVKDFVGKINDALINVEFENDTLFYGNCSAISFALAIHKEDLVEKYSECLKKRFSMYEDVKVSSSPLYSRLGLKRGYIGVAYTVLRLLQKSERRIEDENINNFGF